MKYFRLITFLVTLIITGCTVDDETNALSNDESDCDNQPYNPTGYTFTLVSAESYTSQTEGDFFNDPTCTGEIDNSINAIESPYVEDGWSWTFDSDSIYYTWNGNGSSFQANNGWELCNTKITRTFGIGYFGGDYFLTSDSTFYVDYEANCWFGGAFDDNKEDCESNGGTWYYCTRGYFEGLLSTN